MLAHTTTVPPVVMVHMIRHYFKVEFPLSRHGLMYISTCRLWHKDSKLNCTATQWCACTPLEIDNLPLKTATSLTCIIYISTDVLALGGAWATLESKLNRWGWPVYFRQVATQTVNATNWSHCSDWRGACKHIPKTSFSMTLLPQASPVLAVHRGSMFGTVNCNLTQLSVSKKMTQANMHTCTTGTEHQVYIRTYVYITCTVYIYCWWADTKMLQHRAASKNGPNI